jgi:DNA/RNA endonuclease G (NUC1)
MKKLLFFIILLMPAIWLPAQTINHKAYTIYYDAKIKGPDSVAWNLTPAMVNGIHPKTRVNMFAQDPLLKNGPKPSDFIQVSKDKTLEGAKGHLFSYEDSWCDSVNRRECFYVDQMYWQYQSFNAGDWKTVEIYERSLAKNGTIHVIAGYIGVAQKLSTGIIIPVYMYKAIYHDGQWECWIMPNLPATKGHRYDYWHKTITDINQQTGLKL